MSANEVEQFKAGLAKSGYAWRSVEVRALAVKGDDRLLENLITRVELRPEPYADLPAVQTVITPHVRTLHEVAPFESLWMFVELAEKGSLVVGGLEVNLRRGMAPAGRDGSLYEPWRYSYFERTPQSANLGHQWARHTLLTSGDACNSIVQRVTGWWDAINNELRVAKSPYDGIDDLARDFFHPIREQLSTVNRIATLEVSASIEVRFEPARCTLRNQKLQVGIASGSSASVPRASVGVVVTSDDRTLYRGTLEHEVIAWRTDAGHLSAINTIDGVQGQKASLILRLGEYSVDTLSISADKKDSGRTITQAEQPRPRSTLAPLRISEAGVAFTATHLPHADYDRNAFINCPFDAQYRKIFDAAVFAVMECGFRARCALEVADSSLVRIQKIYALVSACRLGIHDLSRTQLDLASELPRFNMPMEFGIFLGAKFLGDSQQARKVCLVLDTEQYRYQRYISDVAGQDISAHADNPELAVGAIRDWLAALSDDHLPSASKIWERYQTFRSELPGLCHKFQQKADELSYSDYVRHVDAFRIGRDDTLQIGSGRPAENPGARDIRDAVAALKAQPDSFVVLKRKGSGLTFMQAACTADGRFILEYQEGSADEHFRCGDSSLTRSGVERALVWYVESASGWRDEFEWTHMPV